MTTASDPAFIVQIKLAGNWTTALRLGSANDEARAQRTMAKLAEAGHYEAVRILQADGVSGERTNYTVLSETGELEVTNPVPHKLEPKPRFRIERRHGGDWEHAKDLPTRDDAFALALRYHREDPKGAVRVLEETGPGTFTELMHRQPSLGSGHDPARQSANENRPPRPTGMMEALLGGADKRRRNGILMIVCFIGLLIVTRNEINAARDNAAGAGGQEEESLTGLVSAAEMGPERVRQACTETTEVSVNFFLTIQVPPEDQAHLDAYLTVVQTVGTGWSFRQAGDDCHITLTGGAPAPGAAAPTQIDCRIGDFFFTHFKNPAAARAAEGGCQVL